jgi:hypothetical protein
MRLNQLRYGILVVAALTVASCDDDDTLPGGCSGHVASQIQNGNKIQILGSFADGQPIMRLTKNGVNNEIAATDYDDVGAEFDITGVAKGTYTATWILSCFNEEGEVVMTSGVTTVTIA